MHAVVFDTYGPPENLHLVELANAELGDRDIQVAIKAAGINPLDWKIRRGDMKLIPGQHSPHRIGTDFAGVISAVGSAVTDWHPGDEVIGWTSALRGGAYGEAIVVDHLSLVRKPEGLPFREAAAIPTGGIGALQGLRDVGRLKPGQRVLINGCTGGVGMFAVPLAKQLGAHVTGTCGPRSLDAARQINPDVLYDYTQVDIRSRGETFDIVFDLSGRLSFAEAQPLLTAHGIYVDPVPDPATMAGSVLHNVLHAQHHGILMSKPNQEDVTFLVDAIETHRFPILIGREYSLSDAPIAHRDGENGGGIGKSVFIIS